MARNKKGSAVRRFKGQSLSRPSFSGNNPSSASQAGSLRAHGYTLAEEARNTAYNRRGALGRDARLRYKPISFISAGFINPLEDLDIQLATADEAQGNSAATDEPPVAAAADATYDASSCNYALVSAPDQALLAPDALEDTTSYKLEHYSSHESVNYDSDSSEEVILFKGRDRNNLKPAFTGHDKDGVNADSLILRGLSHESHIVEETLHRDTTLPGDAAEKVNFVHLDAKSRERNKQCDKHHKFNRDAVSSDEEAAMIADYIANIKDWEEASNSDEIEPLGISSHSFSVLRELGGADSDRAPHGISTEDGMDNSTEGEADAENQRRLELEDEHMAHMAHMLAKQVELGLGGDDVLLFDGEASDDGWLTAPKAVLHRKRKGDSKRAKITQKKGQYPSATQMADAFDELDLMDRHQLSFGGLNKGPAAFNVSDSELEEAMRSTWQKDRLKKAQKKKARQELRSQGLLGKNIDPDDLRVKYLGGMSLDDLANELEVFLLGSQVQLTLPPFEIGARKTIHALANQFKIKSQSSGKGEGRFPVLYRTKATLPFNQATFDKIFSRIKQTWFPRVDADEKVVNESRIFKRAEARSGKSRFKNSLTYRDGDIVGQHATELGAENKGRAMLEKMGWSKGMALGTKENKGIMVPITHVVKKSKAGLGDA
ncbi:hypothetical protein GGR54DRAFT_628640 [Hypoxylon sp. NC1633]|nr:hypothetical protein GGR54DRAFT_628640 [Hypoxylon sp. NC1633]